MANPQEIDRIGPTLKPDAPVVLHQDWHHLLFLHWEVPPQELQALVAPELTIDTFEGYTTDDEHRLRRARIHHQPYPIQRADILDLEETMIWAAGIRRPAAAALRAGGGCEGLPARDAVNGVTGLLSYWVAEWTPRNPVTQ